MNAQATFQRICAYSGVVCVLLFFGGFVAAGFLPPLSPGMSATQVAAHYQAHTAGIRLGAGLIFLSSGFYVWFTAVISGQMQRIPGVHSTVINAQLMFAVTAFRPDRSPDATLLLNDMSWIMLVMPWIPFMAQYFAFAFAILSDPRPQPLFPRWLAYFNIWAELMFTPAIILPFFKSCSGYRRRCSSPCSSSTRPASSRRSTPRPVKHLVPESLATTRYQVAKPVQPKASASGLCEISRSQSNRGPVRGIGGT